MTLRHLARLILTLVAALAVGGTAARGQTCSFSMDAINFGSVPWTSISSGALTTTATFRANCSGAGAGVLRICVDIDGGTGGIQSAGLYRLMPNIGAASVFRVTLLENASRTTWGTASAATYPPQILDLPDQGAGSRAGVVNAYAAVDSFLAPPYAGQHSSQLRATIRYGAQAASCSLLPQTASLTIPMTLNVLPTCNVLAEALNFGSIFSLDTPSVATTRIYVTCTNGSLYTVTLGNGQNGSSAAARVLKSDVGTLTYALYSDAAMKQVWGDGTSAAAVQRTGTGTQETLVIYGVIPGRQNPPSGTYTDQVIINVVF